MGGERLGAAVAAGEREHQLASQPLTRRVLGDERRELADELGMTAERELGVDSVLERCEAQLLEPRACGLGEALVGEVRERRAAPERERLAQLRRRVRECGLSRVPQQRLEPVEVDLILLDLEQIPG